MRPDTPAQSFIYFIRPVGQRGPVKIGLSRKPAERLRYHQIHSPLPLEYAGMRPGTAEEERALHRRFRATRVHHDWFAPCAELEAEIAWTAIQQQAGP